MGRKQERLDVTWGSGFSRKASPAGKGLRMLEQARSLLPEMIALRRWFHQYPEPSWGEEGTAARIADYLRGLGLEVQTGIARTGVIGSLGSGRPVVMLRADMDALHVQETNDVPYASARPGLMHACGHDVHMACLLGAARLLVADPPPGQVRFLFQPAEEGADAEGKHGGLRVLEGGHMEGVDAVFALHVLPEAPAGVVTVREGVMSSAPDRFWGAVIGRGSHGAYPDQGLDAIALCAPVITAIHQIVSRRVAAQDSAVITIGRIQGGTRHNVVPGRVELEGTVRSYRPQTRQLLLAELERAFRIAETLGGAYELRISHGPPSVVNDPALARLVRAEAVALLGEANVREGEPMMASEDFSWLTSGGVPGCYFRLGTGFAGRANPGLHHSNFDVDEQALAVGAALLAGIARRFLGARG